MSGILEKSDIACSFSYYCGCFSCEIKKFFYYLDSTCYNKLNPNNNEVFYFTRKTAGIVTFFWNTRLKYTQILKRIEGNESECTKLEGPSTYTTKLYADKFSFFLFVNSLFNKPFYRSLNIIMKVFFSKIKKEMDEHIFTKPL